MMTVISRRSILRGLGVSAALAPFVPALSASGDAGGIKRFIFFFTPHGTVWSRWLPAGSRTSFTLDGILSPLERHKAKLNVIDGMRVIAETSVGAPHTKGMPLLSTASPLLEDMTFSRDDGMGVYYYGWNSAPSIDQVIAARCSEGLPYRSLELGVLAGGNHPGQRLSYRAAEQPLAPVQSPYVAFDRLFGGGREGSELAELRARRQSVLDHVTGELSALSPRIAAADRQKLEAHLEAIREVERSLVTEECAGPVLEPSVDVLDPMQVPWVVDGQLGILVRALACNLTNVASFQMSVGENDGNVYVWEPLRMMREHHLTTHEQDPASLDDLASIYTWYAGRFAHLLDLLDSVDEGTGTLLDHSVVVWGSEIGTGWNHDFGRVPFVVAGGCAGAVRTGQFLSLPNVEHNRLYVSLCRAMGLTDVDRFGATDLGNGPLTELLT